ncbi:Opacity protein [bacterium JGI 053]|nr:Opacity protein [bacterium JGI 053]
MLRNGAALALLASIALFAPAVEANAQVSVGVFGGAVSFNVAGVNDSRVKLSHNGGLTAGGLLNVGITDRVSLQLEPMFIQKGAKVAVEGIGDVDVEASYLEVPVLLKVPFGQGRVQPFAMAGPSFGLLLSARQRADFIPREQQDIKDESESFEFGVTGGAGVAFPLSPRVQGFAQGRYHHGLVDTDTAEDESHRSRGWTLVAGVSVRVRN